jgi:PAS domain S-box-containing protein
MNASTVLTGNYDFGQVALSVLISILAANAFLEVAERIAPVHDGSRLFWLYGGAMAMGLGIWAMHYVGMVALQLPVPVLYDWPTVLVSLLIAIVASAVALFIVGQPVMGLVRAISGSIFMGSGIAAMHYVGMEAMRLPAMCRYSPGLVVLSVVLAIVISFVAIQLAFARRGDRNRMGWRIFSSALVMGMAIPVMHYVGMSAVTFVPAPAMEAGMAHAVSITSFGLASIAIATIVILSHVSIIARLDRRLTSQAQQISQGKLELQAIFDGLNEGIVVMDREQNVRRMNRAALRFLGSPGQPASLNEVAEGIDVFLPNGELLPTEKRPAMLALNGHFVKNVDLSLRDKKSGITIVCEVSAAPITNESGEMEQIIISYRDITESRRMDEARAQLAAIVESSEDAIIGKDLNGIVTSWNAGAASIYGYTAQEMIGSPISRLLPPGYDEEEDAILEGIRKGETVKQMETTRVRKDGRQIQVSLSISPIHDTAGRIVGASKIARDITERKALERQLRQGQKMEAIGQLTGGIAHDFNNLLGIIVGNLDLLERVLPDDESARRRLQMAQKAAARGADLTRRLLAFSSHEELNPEPTMLGDAIQNVVELAARTLGPEIRIQTHCDKSVPPVFVDAAGLESALLNLAVNARDAMPKGGSLSISARLMEVETDFPAVVTGELSPGLFAHLDVTDSGSGMSKETLERAFEPFFTTKPRHKGTGLAMVYGFARQSGGTARIYSEEGYGTKVSLYLPLAKGQAEASPVNAGIRQVPKQGGIVLVVDDEADLLEIASAYLTEMGFTVYQAINGTLALEAVTHLGNIDLMVTDVIMPGGINGVELAHRVKQLSPKTKVIFSSGFPSDALEERSGTLVDGPLLRKPYQRMEFAAVIQRMMSD